MREKRVESREARMTYTESEAERHRAIVRWSGYC